MKDIADRVAFGFVERSGAETAEAAYKRVTKDIDRLLKGIQKKLAADAKEFASSGGRNWGYVGSLGYVKEKLEEADESL